MTHTKRCGTCSEFAPTDRHKWRPLVLGTCNAYHRETSHVEGSACPAWRKSSRPEFRTEPQEK